MDKKSASKLLFWMKSFLFVILAFSTFSAYACHHKYHHHRYYSCYKPVYVTNTCYRPVIKTCHKKVVYYYGPTCGCYYCGTDCSVMKWIPCHWDPYGNYVPGQWVVVNR